MFLKGFFKGRDVQSDFIFFLPSDHLAAYFIISIFLFPDHLVFRAKSQQRYPEMQLGTEENCQKRTDLLNRA